MSSLTDVVRTVITGTFWCRIQRVHARYRAPAAYGTNLDPARVTSDCELMNLFMHSFSFKSSSVYCQQMSIEWCCVDCTMKIVHDVKYEENSAKLI